MAARKSTTKNKKPALKKETKAVAKQKKPTTKKPVKKGGKTMATKAKSTTTAGKLPSFFSLANKQFVILLVVIVAAVGIGSWKVYTTRAATDGKSSFPNVFQCYKFKPTLRVGVQNQALCTKTVQQLMNVGGYNAGPVDGIFGGQTRDAVKRFQAANGLGVDGVVGPLTWNGMVTYCNRHSPYNSSLQNVCSQ